MMYTMLAEGFEEVEALAVVDVCMRAGMEVELVSVTGSLQVRGAHGIAIACNSLIEEADFAACDMIFLPGGMPGTTHLYECDLLRSHLDAFVKEGKYLAAICAAPSILGRMGLLEGKDAICFPGFEEQLTGAKIVTGAKVVKCENIFTSRGMGTAIDLGLSIVEAFFGEDKASDLAKVIQYRD